MRDLNLKLNVYEGRNVVKTYETNVFDLYLGTVEDVAHALNFEKIKTGSPAEFVAVVVGCVDVVRPFLCDMFDGLTVEEARHTRTQDVAGVMRDLWVWFTGSMQDAVAENKKK